MSKVSLASLLISLVALGLVVSAYIQSRPQQVQAGAAGDKSAAGADAAPVDARQLQGELEKLRAELASLKALALSIQGGAPMKGIDPAVVSQAIDDLLLEREKAAQEKRLAEIETELRKDSGPWVGMLTQKLGLSEDQTTRIRGILERQIVQGIRMKTDADGDRERKQSELGKVIDAEIQNVMTDAQREKYSKVKKNWHKGRLGAIGD